MTEQDYLTKRVASQRDYFSRKPVRNKNIHFFLSISKMAISFSIPVLSLTLGNASPISIIIAFLAAIIAFTEGLALLGRYNDNWLIYRLTNESLKKEEVLYTVKAGIYHNLEPKECFNMFVIHSSNMKWKKTTFQKAGGQYNAYT